MTSNNHVIAQCVWQTEFDDQKSAFNLQNAISQWSNQVLPGLISKLFDKYCPMNQIWRIEQLVLDLGQIDLSQLDQLLPNKVSAALEEALLKLFSLQKVQFYAAEQPNMRLVDKNTSGLDLVRWHLLHGTLPWWDTGAQSPLEIIDHLLDSQPKNMAQVIRETGPKESVRRRIVWQWQEARSRRVIAILEPWNANFIFEYVENLRKVQQHQSQFSDLEPPGSNPQSNPLTAAHKGTTAQGLIPKDSGFSNHLWYWILTHLLVQRSSVFGTQQFVRFTLWQMTQHYQLDFAEFLLRLTSIARKMQENGLIAPQFIQVLTTLQHQEVTRNEAPQQAPEVNYWQLLQQKLHDSDSTNANTFSKAEPNLAIAELFVRLAQQDARRTGKILKIEGKAESVREFLIAQFDDEQLALVVEVLAPQDHHFILAHVQHTQKSLEARQIQSQLIWQILLSYLLVDVGSYFNRRQFVQHTLTRISQKQRIEYHLLLAILIQQQAHNAPNEQQFELLKILLDLQSESTKHTATSGRFDADSTVLNPLFSPENGVASSGAQDASIERLPLAPSLTKLIQQQLAQKTDKKDLARRILLAYEQSGRLNVSELRQLFSALSPGFGALSTELLHTLLTWQQQGRLLKIQRPQTLHTISEALVASLLEHLTTPMSETRLLNRIVNQLASQSAVSEASLKIQLQINVQQDSNNGVMPSRAAAQLRQIFVSSQQALASYDDAPVMSPVSAQKPSWIEKTLSGAQQLATQSDSERFKTVSVLLAELLNAKVLTWQKSDLQTPSKTAEFLLDNLFQDLNPQQQWHYLMLFYAGLFGRIFHGVGSEKSPDTGTQDPAKLLSNIAPTLRQEIASALSTKCLTASIVSSQQSFKHKAPVVFAIWQHLLKQSHAAVLFQQFYQEHYGQQWLAPFLPTRWRNSGQQASQINWLQKLLSDALSALPAHAKPFLQLDGSVAPEQLAQQLKQVFWQRLTHSWYQQMSGNGSASQLADKLVIENDQQHARWLVAWLLQWAQQQQVSQLALGQVLLHSLDNRTLHAPLSEAAINAIRQQLHKQTGAQQATAGIEYTGPSPRPDKAENLSPADDNQPLSPDSGSFPTGQTLSQKTLWQQDLQGQYLLRQDFPTLLRNWLKDGRITLHSSTKDRTQAKAEKVSQIASPDSEFSIRQMWADILVLQPQLIVEHVAPLWLSASSSQRNSIIQSRFIQYVSWSQMLDAVSRLNVIPVAEMNSLHMAQMLLSKLELNGITWQEKQHWLLNILLKAWLTPDWQLLSPKTLLEQLVWQILSTQACDVTQLVTVLQQPGLPGDSYFLNILSEVVEQLNKSDKTAISQTENASETTSSSHQGIEQTGIANKHPSSSNSIDSNTKSTKSAQPETALQRSNNSEQRGLDLVQKLLNSDAFPKTDDAPNLAEDATPIEFPIALNNAGLALIQSFIRPLFERLNLTKADQFISPAKQRAAVHYLQFLVTGQSHTEEHHLLFNKLICGLAPSQPIEAGIDITPKETDTIHSLIEAVTNYWSAIGKSSVDGFRGNWLIRNGTLTEASDRWDLIVEKRAYDILLERAPMSFSIIKLPWMKKPIYVTWPT